jgi:mannose-6-phosphate isomerase-like protein (cupin superfamily)
MADDRKRSMVRVIAPGEGQSLMGGFAVHKLSGEETGGAFALVEHTLQPHVLAAPMHTHHDVDEVSYVLEGEVGARIGDEEVQAGPGTIILKPRGVPHTFWNAGDAPARLLELISPPGFERYFEELDQLLASMGGQPDPSRISELAARYGMEMDFSSIPELMEKHGVTLGG